MECHDTVLKLLPGPIILCIGFILHVIGSSTVYWSEKIGSHSGLWRVCTIDITNTDTCFTISERGNVPTMVFLCGFMYTISIVIVGLSVLTSFFTLFQKRSRILKWSRNSATASLVAVVLSVSTVCIYGASFHGIIYDNIPNWENTPDTRTLAWSYYISCTSPCVTLLGSLYLILVPTHVLSGNNIGISQQIPVLQIHPPPNDRSPTPLYLLSQRSTSPLPSPFTSKGNHQHQQSLPPVFTQLRR